MPKKVEGWVVIVDGKNEFFENEKDAQQAEVREKVRRSFEGMGFDPDDGRDWAFREFESQLKSNEFRKLMIEWLESLDPFERKPTRVRSK